MTETQLYVLVWEMLPGCCDPVSVVEGPEVVVPECSIQSLFESSSSSSSSDI